MSKWSSFIQGYGLGTRMADDFERANQKREIQDIANQQPVTGEGFTADQGAQLEAAAQSGQYDIAYDEGKKGYTVTPKAGGETGVIAQQGVTDFMGQRTAGTMTPSQVNNARTMAMAGVLSKHGDPAGALRLRAAAGELEAMDRKRADDEELRRVMSQGLPGMPAGTITTQTTGVPVQAHALARAASQAGASMPQTGRAGAAQPGGQFDLNAYLKNVAPRTLETLVKQGKLDEAKRFQEFVNTAEGQDYASAWVDGMRRYAIGDHAGALNAFEDLYNRQLYNDGRTVKLTPQDGGKNYRMEIFDQDGNSLMAGVKPAETIANQAALFLEPSRAVEFHAKEAAARQREAATTERQFQVEDLRQRGREYAEDRRDDRLAQRLSAQSANLDRRLEAQQGRGGLTAAQQRGNFEIDAAREYVSGLDPAEIRRRTAKTTDTGRENPNFDPALAKATSLAARRKIGDDADFDNRSNRPQAAPSIDRQDVAKRFRADRAMNSYRLGKDTANGVEVMDGTGKVIGHYR